MLCSKIIAARTFHPSSNRSIVSILRGCRLHTAKALCRAVVIDGKTMAKEIRNEVKKSVDDWVGSGKRRPKLVAILVGNDPASEVYVGRKVKAAQSVGIDGKTIRLSGNVKQKALIDEIERLNEDSGVDGILVQLPLPRELDEREACHMVSTCKDVDGFHVENLGKLCSDSRGFVPATALAVRELIIRSGVETRGRNALIIGRSKHVGLPIALLLHANGKGQTGALDMTTTICHVHTPPEELEKYGKLADVLVSATGVPGLVNKNMIKPGACVIDVGITRIVGADGKIKIVGDVDYERVREIAGHITPVPGGVGPMTVAMLMRNTFLAAEKNLSPTYS